MTHLRNLKRHTGFNPAHVIGGYDRAIRIPPMGIVGYRPRNPSRWMPHQSTRECARRMAQAARKAEALV